MYYYYVRMAATANIFVFFIISNIVLICIYYFYLCSTIILMCDIYKFRVYQYFLIFMYMGNVDVIRYELCSRIIIVWNFYV